MNLYVYQLNLNEKYQDVSAWDAGVQLLFQEHASYLRKGVKAGKVLIVARTNTNLRDNFGIAVFQAEDAADAERFMLHDPIVRNGIMSARCYPFKLLMVTEEAKNWSIWSSGAPGSLD